MSRPNLVVAVSNTTPEKGSGAEDPTPAADELRMKEFLDRVADRAEMKRSDARAAAKLALEVLGEALAEGRDMRLPGLGKLKVQSSKANDARRVTTVRIVRDVASDPLAGDGEDS